LVAAPLLRSYADILTKVRFVGRRPGEAEAINHLLNYGGINMPEFTNLLHCERHNLTQYMTPVMAKEHQLLEILRWLENFDTLFDEINSIGATNLLVVTEVIVPRMD
jgi:Holliday junction resolvasome RuvABC ATP-dependent DNA helicase subunit